MVINRFEVSLKTTALCSWIRLILLHEIYKNQNRCLWLIWTENPENDCAPEWVAQWTKNNNKIIFDLRSKMGDNPIEKQKEKIWNTYL